MVDLEGVVVASPQIQHQIFTFMAAMVGLAVAVARQLLVHNPQTPMVATVDMAAAAVLPFGQQEPAALPLF
jgi:hypothetical protein